MSSDLEEQRQVPYLAGLKAFGEDRHEDAIAKYEETLAISPDWTDALHGKAMALMQLGRFDEAIEVGQRIVELDPNDSFAHTSLSMFYQRKGMIEEAEKEGAKARMLSWKEELKKNPDARPPGPAGSMPVIQ
ncbi:MAG: tetratricopeptide repeat protein [Planctomycetota bacterium]